MHFNVDIKKKFRVELSYPMLGVLIFVFSLLVRFVYSFFLKTIYICPDTWEYLDASSNILSFKVDASRVPVYPLFIQAARKAFPYMDSMLSITLLQSIFSSLTAVLCFYIAILLFSSRTKALIFSLLCTTCIFIINWDFLILTESLTIFFIALLVYNMILYFKNSTKKHISVSYAICFLLIYTKPFYLFLPVLIFAFSLFPCILEKVKNQTLILGLISLAVIYGSIFAYSQLNFKQNGYSGISNVSSINSLGKVLQYNMYKLGNNDKIINIIDTEIAANNGQLPIPIFLINSYGLYENNYAEISSFTRSIIVKHPFLYCLNTINFILTDLSYRRIFTDYNFNMGNYKSGWLYPVITLLNNLFLVNSFFVSAAFVLFKCYKVIKKIIKEKFWDLNWIFIIALIAYQFILSVFGAQGEYHRLMSPVYIPVFLVICEVIFKLYAKYGYVLKRRVSTAV